MWRNFQRKWVYCIPIFSWSSNLHCPIKDSLNYASYSWLTRDFEKAWKARRLGRLRMDGCETHAPVCITLRDRKRSYPALREEFPPSRTKASKEPVSSSKQNDRSKNEEDSPLFSSSSSSSPSLFLRAKESRKKDGARCILNTRILTSKQRRGSHEPSVCDSLSPCLRKLLFVLALN